MIYKSCSIDSVIGRIIRNTRVQDNSFILDFYEWIPEAMGVLKTNQQLKYAWKDIPITFHMGKLPCGLIHIEAVEYNCYRLGWGDSVRSGAAQRRVKSPPQTDVFISAVIPPGTATMYTSTLTAVNTLPMSQHEFYQIQLDAIITSFDYGTIRVHYKAEPCDDKGLPLIPDNESYKEAIYYYCRAKMIGAGYIDKVFSERELMERFEFHGARAVAEITYPSPDQMEKTLQTLTRFIPPANYYENFFRVDGPEMPYI